MGRIGLALLGIPLMAIGLVGWILPFIPGLPLFLLGLAMTISWHPKGKALTDRCNQWIKERAIRHGLTRRNKAEIQADLFCPGETTSGQIKKQ